VHVVAPGESIYSIAVSLAGGDSGRALEIADAIIDANIGTVMPGGQRFTNPAYVEVSWTLRLPAEIDGSRAAQPETGREAGAGAAAATYTVERGDTLWDIADEQLGDPTAWPEIWERNAGDDMGDGRTFDDPDLILPGWELELADVDPVDTSPESTVEVVPPAPTEVAVAEPAAPTSDAATVDTAPTTDVATGDTAPTTSIDESFAEGPLPLTPTTPTSTAPASTTTTTTSATTTVPPPADPASDPAANPPEAPSPIRLEHAALLAAGVLALVGVRRRRRLRAAMPRHRVPEPREDVARTERTLRTIDAGERVMRADVACRAAARSLIGLGSQIGWVEVSPDGAAAAVDR
jgi:MYXO-CTERM domain-containing protein